MHCTACRDNKISPTIPPFGGFFCAQEHVQCLQCNIKNKGICAICSSPSNFVQICFGHMPTTRIQIDEVYKTDDGATQMPNAALKNRLIDSVEVPAKPALVNRETQSWVLPEQRRVRESFTQSDMDPRNCGYSNSHVSNNSCYCESTTSAITSDMGFLSDALDGETSVGATAFHGNDPKYSLHNDNAHTRYTNVVGTSGACFERGTDSLRNLYITDTSRPSTSRCCNHVGSHELPPNFPKQEPYQAMRNHVGYMEHTGARRKVPTNVASCYCQHSSHVSNKCTNIPSKMPLDTAMPMTSAAALVASAGIESTKLKENTNLDARLDKVLGTFREERLPQNLDDGARNYMVSEPPVGNELKDQQEVQQEVQQVEEDMASSRHEDNDNQAEILRQLVNVHRAYYNPPRPDDQGPPPPQYQVLPCSKSMTEELMKVNERYLNIKPKPAALLHMPRTPIICPDTNCMRSSFLSDFTKHLVMEHRYLVKETIAPFENKNFVLDHRLSSTGITRCHYLYLMKDRIMNLGTSQYKDYLPILVLSSRISLADMIALNSRGQQKDSSEKNEKKKKAPKFAAGRNSPSGVEFLLIWLAGLAPEDFPVSTTLTIWANTGPMPKCHIVTSCQLYPIHNSQKGIDVFQNASPLMLSQTEIDILSRGGTELLNLQLSVH